MKSAFFDGSSAEPLLPEARHAWLAAQDAGWGDPRQLHRPGRLAAQALDEARTVVAQAVGARPDEVVFTGSGAQSSQAAVAGLALGRRRSGSSLVTSTIEHSAVLSAADAAGDHLLVGVDHWGRLDLAQWEQAVSASGVAAACLQVANHEVGTLQPFPEAAQLCRRAEVPLVLDATSALGRVDLSSSADWSVLTGAAAAFGGPASVGLLVIRRGTRWRAPNPVDDYQASRWLGAPDVPAIYAAAVALDVWLTDGVAVSARQQVLVDTLRAGVSDRITDVDLAGDPVDRVPHLFTFSVLYVDGETLTLRLDQEGFAVASGSACSSTSEHPSHVLAAMGALTHGNVRIGVTRTTTEAEVERFLEVLPPVVARIRASLGTR